MIRFLPMFDLLLLADMGIANQYTVIDNVEKLLEKLPQLFMALTK